MDEEDSLRHTRIHRRKRFDPMVSIHLHLPASDRKYVQSTDFWKPALHGTTSNGRDADLGYLRESSFGSVNLSDSLHHCAPHDERKTSIAARGAGGLHLQPSVSQPCLSFAHPFLTQIQSDRHWRCKNLLDVSRPTV